MQVDKSIQRVHERVEYETVSPTMLGNFGRDFTSSFYTTKRESQSRGIVSATRLFVVWSSPLYWNSFFAIVRSFSRSSPFLHECHFELNRPMVYFDRLVDPRRTIQVTNRQKSGRPPRFTGATGIRRHGRDLYRQPKFLTNLALPW